MREPQVVFTPAVISTSLCATGMPVSGCASPAAMRASAVRAACSARSRSTVRNALSFGSSVSIRSRAVRVSSTLDTRFSASERESSDSDAESEVISLNDFGYQIQPVVYRRRDALVERVAVGLADVIVAQRGRHLLRMRHRHDACGVDRAHFIDELEDAVELALHVLRLGRRYLDPGEMRDALDVLNGDGHVEKAAGKCRFRKLSAGFRARSGAEAKHIRLSYFDCPAAA